MKLENIPFNEYLKLDEDAAYLYTYSYKFGMFLNKQGNYFELKPIREYTFGQVKDAQTMIENGIMIGDIPRIISIFSTQKLESIYRQGVIEVFQQFAYIRDQIRDILEIEKAALVRALTDKEIKAGLERFEKYGVYPQLKSFANSFGQSIEWARNQSYEDGFVELCYQKDQSEYSIDLSNVK